MKTGNRKNTREHYTRQTSTDCSSRDNHRCADLRVACCYSSFPPRWLTKIYQVATVDIATSKLHKIRLRNSAGIDRRAASARRYTLQRISVISAVADHWRRIFGEDVRASIEGCLLAAEGRHVSG